jgi:hypothetical protein
MNCDSVSDDDRIKNINKDNYNNNDNNDNENTDTESTSMYYAHTSGSST